MSHSGFGAPPNGAAWQQVFVGPGPHTVEGAPPGTVIFCASAGLGMLVGRGGVPTAASAFGVVTPQAPLRVGAGRWVIDGALTGSGATDLIWLVQSGAPAGEPG